MKTAHFIFATALAMGAALSASGSVLAADQPHNIVLFVADGLRARIVNNQTAPVMASVRDKGVRFANSHSIFPTFTTANASSMATGHFLGDTGDFSNTIYTGFPVPGAGNSLTPFLESDPVLGDIDEHFSGDYLDEITILRAAREAGFQTAAIGKLGPTLIFDHTERTGQKTVIIDDFDRLEKRHSACGLADGWAQCREAPARRPDARATMARREMRKRRARSLPTPSSKAG